MSGTDPLQNSLSLPALPSSLYKQLQKISSSSVRQKLTRLIQFYAYYRAIFYTGQKRIVTSANINDLIGLLLGKSQQDKKDLQELLQIIEKKVRDYQKKLAQQGKKADIALNQFVVFLRTFNTASSSGDKLQESIEQVKLPTPQHEPAPASSLKHLIFQTGINSAVFQVKKRLAELQKQKKLNYSQHQECLAKLDAFIKLFNQQDAALLEIRFVYNSATKDYGKIVLLKKSNGGQSHKTEILHVFEVGSNGQAISAEVLLLQFLLKKSGYAMEGARWGVMDNTTASALYQYMSTYSLLYSPEVQYAQKLVDSFEKLYQQIVAQREACLKNSSFKNDFVFALEDKLLAIFDRLIAAYDRAKAYYDSLHSDVKNPKYVEARKFFAQKVEKIKQLIQQYSENIKLALEKRIGYISKKISLYKSYIADSKKANRYLEESLSDIWALAQRLKSYDAHMLRGTREELERKINEKITELNALVFGNFALPLKKYGYLMARLYGYYISKIDSKRKVTKDNIKDLMSLLFGKEEADKKELLDLLKICQNKVEKYQEALKNKGVTRDIVLDQFIYWMKRSYLHNVSQEVEVLYVFAQALRGKKVSQEDVRIGLFSDSSDRNKYFSDHYNNFVQDLSRRLADKNIPSQNRTKLERLLFLLGLLKDLHETGDKYSFLVEKIDSYHGEKSRLLHQSTEHIKAPSGDKDTPEQVTKRYQLAYRIFGHILTESPRIRHLSPYLLSLLSSYMQKSHGVSAETIFRAFKSLATRPADRIYLTALTIAASQDQSSRGIDRPQISRARSLAGTYGQVFMAEITKVKWRRRALVKGSESLYSALQNIIFIFFTEIRAFCLAHKINGVAAANIYKEASVALSSIFKLISEGNLSKEEQIKTLRLLENIDFNNSDTSISAKQLAQAHDEDKTRSVLRNDLLVGDNFVQRASSISVDGRFLGHLINRYAKAEVIPQLLSFEAMLELSQLTTLHLAAEANKVGKHRVVLAYLKACNSPMVGKIEKGQALNKEEAIILGSLLFAKKYDQAAIDKARDLLAQTSLTDTAIKTLNNNYFLWSRDGYLEYVSPADKARYTQGQEKASLVEVKPGGTIESEDKQTVLEDRPLVVYKMILLKQFSSTSGGVEFRQSRGGVVPGYLDANDISNIANLFSRKHFKLSDHLAITEFEKRALDNLFKSGQLNQAEKIVLEKIYKGESTYSEKDIETLRTFSLNRLKGLMAKSPIEEKQWLTNLYMKLQRALLLISRINGLSTEKGNVLKKLAGEMARKGIHIVDLTLHLRPYYSGSKLTEDQQKFNQLYIKAMDILRDVHYQLILASKKYHEEDQKPKGGKTRWESLQNFVGFHYRTTGKLMFQTIKPPSPLLMTYLGIGSTDALMVKYLLYPKLAAEIVKLTNEVKSMDETIKKETQQFDFKEYHRIYKEIKANREALEELLKNKKTELGKDKKEFLDGILGELRRLENLLNYGVVSPIQVFYLLADIKGSIEKLTLIKFARQEAVFGKDKAPEVLGNILANLNQLKSLMNNFTVRSNKLKELFIQRQEKAIQLQELQTRLLSENLTREDWIRLRTKMASLFPQNIRGKILAWAGRLISGEEQEVSRPDKSVIHQSPLQLIDAYFAAKVDKAEIKKILGSNWKHLFVEFVGKGKKNQKPQLVFLPHIGEKQIREMVTDKKKQAQLLAIYRLASLRILSMGGGAVPGENLAATYAKTAYSLVMMSIPRKTQASYLRIIPSLFFPTTSLHGIFSFVRDPLAIIGGALPGVSLTFGNRTIDDIKNLTSFKLLAQKVLSWGALATDAHQTQNLAGSLHMVLMQYSRNGSEHIARLFSRMIDKNIMPWDKFRLEDIILLYFYLTTELIPAMKNNPELRNKILALLNVKREIKINPFSKEYMSKLRELIVNLVKEYPAARKIWNDLAGEKGVKAESLSITSFEDPKGQDTEILKKFMEKVIKGKVFFFDQELPESAKCKKLTGFWGQRSVLLTHLSYVVESLFKIVEVINKTNAYIDPTRQEYNNFDLGYIVEEATGQKDVRNISFRAFVTPGGIFYYGKKNLLEILSIFELKMPSLDIAGVPGGVKFSIKEGYLGVVEHSKNLANIFYNIGQDPKELKRNFNLLTAGGKVIDGVWTVGKGKVEGAVKFEYMMAKHIALGFGNMWGGFSSAAASLASGDEKAFLEGMFRFYKGMLETGASFFVFESMPAVFYLDVLRLVQKKEYAKALAMAWAILNMSHLSLISFLRVSKKVGFGRALWKYGVAGQMQPMAEAGGLVRGKMGVWGRNLAVLGRHIKRMLAMSDPQYEIMARQSLEQYGNASLFNSYAIPYWMHQSQLMNKTGYKVLYYALNPAHIAMGGYRLVRDYIIYERQTSMRVLPGYSYEGVNTTAAPQTTSAPVGTGGRIWRYGTTLAPHYVRRGVGYINPHNWNWVRRSVLPHITSFVRSIFQRMIPASKSKNSIRVSNENMSKQREIFEAKFKEINRTISEKFNRANFVTPENVRGELARLWVQENSQVEFIIARQRNVEQLKIRLAELGVDIDAKNAEMSDPTKNPKAKLALAKEILKLQQQYNKIQFQIYSTMGQHEALKLLAQDYRNYHESAHARANDPSLPEIERTIARDFAKFFERWAKAASDLLHDVQTRNRVVFERETFFKLLEAKVNNDIKAFKRILKQHNRANPEAAYRLGLGGYKSLWNEFQAYREAYLQLGNDQVTRQAALEQFAKDNGIEFIKKGAELNLYEHVKKWLKFQALDTVHTFKISVPMVDKNGAPLLDLQGRPAYENKSVNLTGRQLVELLWASSKPHLFDAQTMPWWEKVGLNKETAQGLAQRIMHDTGNGRAPITKASIPVANFDSVRHLFVDPNAENLVFKPEITKGDVKKCLVPRTLKKILLQGFNVIGQNFLIKDIQTAFNVLPKEVPSPLQAAAKAMEPVAYQPAVISRSGMVDFYGDLANEKPEIKLNLRGSIEQLFYRDLQQIQFARLQVEQQLEQMGVRLEPGQRVLVFGSAQNPSSFIYMTDNMGRYYILEGENVRICNNLAEFQQFLKELTPAQPKAAEPAPATQTPEPSPAPKAAEVATEPDSVRSRGSQPVILERPFIETGFGRVDIHINMGLVDDVSRTLAAISFERSLQEQQVPLDGNKRALIYRSGRETNFIIYEPLPDGRYQVDTGKQVEILTAEQFEKLLKGQWRSPGIGFGPAIEKAYPGKKLEGAAKILKEARAFEKIRAQAQKYGIEINSPADLQRVSREGLKALREFLSNSSSNTQINYAALIENKNFQQWLFGTKAGRTALPFITGQRPLAEASFATLGGMIVGFAVILGAEKAADILGIENKALRFLFVLGCGHIASVQAQRFLSLERVFNFFVKRAMKQAGLTLPQSSSSALFSESLLKRTAKKVGLGAFNIIKGIGYGIYVSQAYDRFMENLGIDKNSWMRHQYVALGAAIAVPSISQGILHYIEKRNAYIEQLNARLIAQGKPTTLRPTKIFGLAPKVAGRVFGVVTWGALALDLGSSVVISDYRKSFLTRLVEKVRTALISDARANGGTKQWVATFLADAHFSTSHFLFGHFANWVFEKLNNNMDHVVRPAIQEILAEDLKQFKNVPKEIMGEFSLILELARKSGISEKTLEGIFGQKVTLSQEDRELFERAEKLKRVYMNIDSIAGWTALLKAGRITQKQYAEHVRRLQAMAAQNYPTEQSLYNNIANRLGISVDKLHLVYIKMLAMRFQEKVAKNLANYKIMQYYAQKIQIPMDKYNSSLLSYFASNGTLTKTNSFQRFSLAVQEEYSKSFAKGLAAHYKKHPSHPLFRIMRSKLRLKLWQKLGTMEEFDLRRKLQALGDDFKWLAKAQKGNTRYVQNLARAEARIIRIRKHYERRILRLNEASKREAKLLRNNDPALAKKLKALEYKYGTRMIYLMQQCRMDLAAQDIRLASLGDVNKAGRS